MRVRPTFLLFAFLAVSVAACSGPSDRREFTLQGQILSMTPDHKEATIKHEEIKGFMSAMTMPYHVRDAKQFENIAPGDLISATLVVVSNDAYLKDVKKVGTAPLETPAAQTPSATSSGVPLLKEGEPVPDAQFVDQDGKNRSIASFKGSAVLLTFTYTRCPMPTFCPLMDKNFATIQEALKKDRDLNVQLATISFDPATDTPAVLKQHAADAGANPKLWTFLTGNQDVIDQFASRFGVFVTRGSDDSKDITHNLRTAILDRQGNLVKIYTGNEWTPSQALADIKVLVGVD
jgi:protein SCO1/2